MALVSTGRKLLGPENAKDPRMQRQDIRGVPQFTFSTREHSKLNTTDSSRPICENHRPDNYFRTPKFAGHLQSKAGSSSSVPNHLPWPIWGWFSPPISGTIGILTALVHGLPAFKHHFCDFFHPSSQFVGLNAELQTSRSFHRCPVQGWAQIPPTPQEINSIVMAVPKINGL